MHVDSKEAAGVLRLHILSGCSHPFALQRALRSHQELSVLLWRQPGHRDQAPGH